MDDIVVIILTLVVTGFGIYNQHRKKKAASAQVSAEPKETPDFWDMIMDKADVVEEEEVLVPKPREVVKEKRESVVKPKYNFTPSAEGQSDIDDAVKKQITKKRKVRIDGEEFSLRKAVIYNEILKRKYS